MTLMQSLLAAVLAAPMAAPAAFSLIPNEISFPPVSRRPTGAARIKREAVKRRNIRARASK